MAKFKHMYNWMCDTAPQFQFLDLAFSISELGLTQMIYGPVYVLS